MYGVPLVPGFSAFIIFLKNKYGYFTTYIFLKGWGISDNPAQAAHIAQKKRGRDGPFLLLLLNAPTWTNLQATYILPMSITCTPEA